MTKSNGIKDLKQAAKLLNKHSPDGESLAYINPEEAKLLKSRGGSGIETLSGVPTYGILDWVTQTALPWVGDKVGSLIGGRYSDQEAVYKNGKMTERAQSGLGNLARDAFSVWGALKAKKDQEGLNAAEQEQFNKLNQQLAAAETQFNVDTDFGMQLKAPTNVPETIEDVSVFKETTGRPDMKTTAVAEGGRIGFNAGGSHKAWLTSKGYKDMMKGMSAAEITALYDSVKGTWSKAQGGRIGAFNGGIQGLMPQQGMPQQGLDPRMGYALGGPGVSENLEFVDKIYSPEARTLAGMSEKPGGLLQETKYDKDTNTRDFTFSEDITMPGQAHTRETLDAANQMLDIQEMKKLQLEKLALNKGWTKEQFDKRYWELVKQQKGGVEGWGESTQYDDLNEALSMLQYDIGVWSNWEGDQDPQSVDMRLQNPNYLPLPESMQSSYEPNAQGGRIGYQEGTHPLDGVAMQMFGMTFENLNPLQQIVVSQSQSKAQGGRIGAEKGGIMPLLNMGGMEKDYRQDGGFVPIGRKEKADDVPARLSKNEFVFTADAVRNAGGGDIDQGAQRMYNVMKNLEAGGEISEQSQGQG